MKNDYNKFNTSRPIKEILAEIKNQPVINKGISDTLAIKAWTQVLGNSIMRITTNVYIKDRVMFAHLNSSVIRHELFLNKKQIIASINEYVGSNAIYDIILK